MASGITSPTTGAYRGLCARLLVVLAATLSGCSGGPGGNAGPESPGTTPRDDQKYRIVTTCGMVTDIVRNVAGDCAEVVGLMGEGVDPHLHNPTRDDVRELKNADVVFYSGLLLEGKFGDTFAQLKKSGKPVIAVTEQIEKSYLRHPKEFEGHPDPHVWMDVGAWIKCTELVAAKLSEFDPRNADGYSKRIEAYKARLAKLDEYVRKTIASIPEKQRVLVTAHDAFGYFARAYKIQVKSVQGITTDSTPGVKDINELVAFLIQNKIQSIFVEESVSRDNIRAVIEGAGQKGHEVRIGGSLYSDSMGPAGTYEGTYIGMMDHNATTIARALGGQASKGGMEGKLTAKSQAE